MSLATSTSTATARPSRGPVAPTHVAARARDVVGRVRDPAAARIAGAGVLALASLRALALLTAGMRARQPKPPRRRDESRALHASAVGLFASVLADSAIQHDRGSFENPGMFAPLLVSALGILVGSEAAAASRLPAPARRGAYRLALAVGVAGVGFHVVNVLRQPGGLSWVNVFYAAPLGAPAALALGGSLGVLADAAASDAAGTPARIAGVPLGRAACGVVAAGLAGTVGEVALLHYRGSFHNPLMWLPVSLPPVAAALTARAALDGTPRRDRGWTRAWLRLTALLGIGGVGLHAYGVSRAMGGWRNWRQNVVDGPPLPAPPSFSALALAGLAALRLRDRDDG